MTKDERKNVLAKYNGHCAYCGVELDPIYESKCIPFLKSMDLLWIVGHRILK